MRPSRPPKFTGLFFDETAENSAWIRERGTLHLPPLANAREIAIIGEMLPPGNSGGSEGNLGLEIKIDGRSLFTGTKIKTGPFRIEVPWSHNSTFSSHEIELRLCGVTNSNFLAWLGRITGFGFLQIWRTQPRNRRLRIQRIEAGGQVLYDFSNRSSPWNTAIARSTIRLGLNLVGYFRAVLGIGESARCAARSADAAGVGVALVDLKLHTKNPLVDSSFNSRLQTDNPYPVNVFHLDAPAARDIDHHHGQAFRSEKYNIGYWAWELPEFPDSWVHFAEYFDEIWAPSHFAADAIAQKVAVPVLTMPHSISFSRPVGDFRSKFALPGDKYLFLFLYDLNSYSERKNPVAVIDAFRRSGLAGKGAGLVIKVHNVESNPTDFDRLRAATASLPDTILITQTLSHAEIYELETACDCFVSLHRSEGFGIAVAECMFLGKPVISTDWSATKEFVNADNGCPVRCELVTLERNHGPYAKGQTWASPDIDHAAEWMKRLFHDPALGKSLGIAARETIEKNYSPAAIGARYRKRLEAIAGW